MIVGKVSTMNFEDVAAAILWARCNCDVSRAGPPTKSAVRRVRRASIARPVLADRVRPESDATRRGHFEGVVESSFQDTSAGRINVAI